MGTYDQKLGTFRRPSKYYKKGVSDIIGYYRGRFLAIEVKSARGKLTLDQKLFLDCVNKMEDGKGGLGFVARSVLEVEAELAKAV